MQGHRRFFCLVRSLSSSPPSVGLALVFELDGGSAARRALGRGATSSPPGRRLTARVSPHILRAVARPTPAAAGVWARASSCAASGHRQAARRRRVDVSSSAPGRQRRRAPCLVRGCALRLPRRTAPRGFSVPLTRSSRATARRTARVALLKPSRPTAQGSAIQAVAFRRPLPGAPSTSVAARAGRRRAAAARMQNTGLTARW
jgi:hypothetical protein